MTVRYELHCALDLVLARHEHKHIAGVFVLVNQRDGVRRRHHIVRARLAQIVYV